MIDRVRPRLLINAMFLLLREDALAAACAGIALAALGIAWDLLLPSSPNNLLFTAASIAAQFVLLRRTLARHGALLEGSGSRGGSFVVLGFLSGLGVALGLLLLILPGLILAVLWAASGPILIGEGCTAAESLGESWRRCRGSEMAIALAYLVPLVPMLAGLAVPMLSAGSSAPATDAEILLSNVLLSGWLVLSWYLSLAVYFALRDRDQHLQNVFG